MAFNIVLFIMIVAAFFPLGRKALALIFDAVLAMLGSYESDQDSSGGNHYDHFLVKYMRIKK